MAAHSDIRPVILASTSPRRRELLALGGIDFQVRPVAADESVRAGEDPHDYVQRLSRTKARLAADGAAANGAAANLAASEGASEPGPVVVGADTTVVLDGDILGKPADAGEATEMLRRLRGRTHRVLTAVSVLDTASQAEHGEVVTAAVPMRDYGDDEIAAYVATGNPLDKAGAYAIQFAGFKPVDGARFSDCFANVMGLPACRVLSLLEQAGVPRGLSRAPGDCRHFEARACPVYPLINKDGE